MKIEELIENLKYRLKIFKGCLEKSPTKAVWLELSGRIAELENLIEQLEGVVR